MRFLFDCEDEICLPMAYHLVDDIKPFIDKVKVTDIDGVEGETDRKVLFKKVVENIMVKHPKETSELLSKFWVLDEIDIPLLDDKGLPVVDKDGNPIMGKGMEKAPNSFKTMAELFKSEVAVDFFTSVLPSLLTISKEVSPLLK